MAAGLARHGVAPTPTSVRVGRSGALWTYGAGRDLPRATAGELSLWTSPALTVATDYAGGRTVRWTSTGTCWVPRPPCLSVELLTASDVELSGASAPSDGNRAWLESLDDATDPCTR